MKESARIPVGLYIEDPKHQRPKRFLDEETYAAAIEAFVIVSTDVVIINPHKRIIYLTRRCIKPMKGWWIIGGRMFAGEMPEESMQRCFQRETSLNLSQERFQLVRFNRNIWKDRKQEPQEMGIDFLTYLFSVELTSEELEKASCSLDPSEYETNVGLQEFNLERLEKENAHPALIDLYKQLFP